MNPKPNFEKYKKDQEEIEKIPHIKPEFHFAINDIAKKYFNGEQVTEKEIDELEMVYDMTQDLEKEIVNCLDMYRSKRILEKIEFLIAVDYFLSANQNGPASKEIRDLFLNQTVSVEEFKTSSNKISIPENVREILVSVYGKIAKIPDVN